MNPISTFHELNGYVVVTNENGESVSSKNIVVYGGGDIISKLLSGDMTYRIATMYFSFDNAASPTWAAAARTDTADSRFWSAGPGTRDYIRVPTLAPSFSASDVNHSFNRAQYLAITGTPSTGEKGVSYGAGSGSKIGAMGLVASPTGARPGDVLYAYYVLPSPLAVVGSGQISAVWTTEAI
jgi:hypothetical protein